MIKKIFLATLLALTFFSTNLYAAQSYFHILSTGQSLSLGTSGAPALTSTQMFKNKSLDANNLLINLGELNQETMSTAMTDTLTNFAINFGGLAGVPEYNLIVTKNGVGAAAYSSIKKGTAPYQKGIGQIQAAKSITTSQNILYSVKAVTNTHGESDIGIATSTQYEAYLKQWQSDYENDIKQVTGQTGTIPMFIDQVSSWGGYNWATPTTAIGQYLAAKNNLGKIIMVTPKYFLDYNDIAHLNNYSYRRLGEYYGKVMFRVLVQGIDWKPVAPKSITINQNIISATFDTPYPYTPLTFDTNAVKPVTNYGFEFFDSTNSASITKVELVGDYEVRITLSKVPTGSNQRLRYAFTSLTNGGVGYPTTPILGSHSDYGAKGNLRDQDQTPALHIDNTFPAYFGKTLPNWAVTFDEPIISTPTSPTPTFSPSSLSSLSLWLDTQDTNSLSTPGTWKDKSGNNNNAVKAISAAATSAPTFNATGDSNASVQFDGIDDYLEVTKTQTPSFEVFVVADTDTNVWNDYGAFISSRGANGFMITPVINSKQVTSHVFGATGFVGSDVKSYQTVASFLAATSITNKQIFSTSFSDTASLAISTINGIKTSTSFSTTVPRTTTQSLFKIGKDDAGGRYGREKIREIIVYNRQLTDAERVQIQSYLNTKWGISSAAIAVAVPSQVAVSPSSTGVFLTFLPSATIVTDYIYEFKSAATTTWSVFVDTISTMRNVTINNLLSSTVYEFRFRALNNGIYSDYTSVSSTTTLGLIGTSTIMDSRNVPVITSATGVNKQVLLSWKHPSITENLLGYQIQYLPPTGNWLIYNKSFSTSTKAIVNNLINNANYQFRVEAVYSTTTAAGKSNTVSSTPKNIDSLYFVINGESNSGGIGENSSATVSELATRTSVKITNLFDGGFVFENLKIGWNNLRDHYRLEASYFNSHGLELSLANSVDSNYFGIPTVYLTKTGQGGSTIGEWGVGGTWWTKFLERVNAAKSQLVGSRQYVVWYSQGINDANSNVSSETWKSLTIAHLNKIKQELPGVVIFITKFESMGVLPSGGTMAEYNSTIDAIANSEANVFAVSSLGSEVHPGLYGALHWNYRGFKTLGDGMALSTREILGIDSVINTGPITVQPPTPSSLPALSLWLDAQDTVSLSTPGTWKDKSGNNNNAVKATSAAATSVPTFNTTGDLNASVQFDGIDDYLEVTKTQTPSFEAFVVADTDTNVWNDYGAFMSSRGANGFMITPRLNMTNLSMHVFGGSGFISAENSYAAYMLPTTPITSKQVYSTSYNNDTSAAISFIGNQKSVGNLPMITARATSPTAFKIGKDDAGGRYGREKIREIIVYNRQLTDAERVQIQSYLNTKWGI